jgi:hypothetical protein
LYHNFALKMTGRFSLLLIFLGDVTSLCLSEYFQSIGSGFNITFLLIKSTVFKLSHNLQRRLLVFWVIFINSFSDDKDNNIYEQGLEWRGTCMKQIKSGLTHHVLYDNWYKRKEYFCDSLYFYMCFEWEDGTFKCRFFFIIPGFK